MATKDDDNKTVQSQPKAGAPVQQGGPQGDVRKSVEQAHEARITVPGASKVDARLDNRTGADRPPLEKFPAKPQQVDGPDVIHQVEHTRATLKKDALGNDVGDPGARKGMFSPGPHGLSDESLREGETSFGTEGLVDEAAKGSPKAD